MKTNTTHKILKAIESDGTISPHQIGQAVGVGQVSVHRQLKKLLSQGLIEKVGSPPVVFYQIKKITSPTKQISWSSQIRRVVEDNYLYLAPDGVMKSGVEGFVAWAVATKQDINLDALVGEYIKTITQASTHLSKDGLINATSKLAATFSKIWVDRVYYQSFYSLPKFGKTKLGVLVLHAKQSQSLKLMQQVISQMEPVVMRLIKKHRIQAVGFIPHSIPRNKPLLKIINQKLKLGIPQIDLVKAYRGEVLVAQKSLAKLEERVVNARESIFIKDDAKYQRVLLIDDAVGSGATLNETAHKLKKKGVKTVIGYAIVGSMKGFSVIKEI